MAPWRARAADSVASSQPKSSRASPPSPLATTSAENSSAKSMRSPGASLRAGRAKASSQMVHLLEQVGHQGGEFRFGVEVELHLA